MDQPTTADVDLQGGSSSIPSEESAAKMPFYSSQGDDDLIEIIDVRQGQAPRHWRKALPLTEMEHDDEIEIIAVRQGEIPDFHKERTLDDFMGDDECRIESVTYSPFIPRFYSNHPLAPRTLTEQRKLKERIAADQHGGNHNGADSGSSVHARKAIKKRKLKSRPIVSGSVDSARRGEHSSNDDDEVNPPSEIFVPQSKKQKTTNSTANSSSSYGDMDDSSDQDVTSTPSSKTLENSPASGNDADCGSESSLSKSPTRASSLRPKSPGSKLVAKTKDTGDGRGVRRISWQMSRAKATTNTTSARSSMEDVSDLLEESDDDVYRRTFSLDKFERYFETAVKKACNCSTFQLEDSPAVKHANTRVDPRDSTGQTRAQYGRILPEATDNLLREHLRLSRSDIFIDVGHGIGNTVLQAAYTIGCEARGIEVTSDRHMLAARIQQHVFAQAKAPGKAKLVHGRMEVKEHRAFLSELGRRPVKVFCNNFNCVFGERSKKTFQKYTLDDYLAGLFSYMAPGSKLATLHELTFNANPLADANDHREMHSLPRDENASYYEFEKIVLGRQNECVSW
eukprot:CAMPEP_0168720774 /NCGR_PEP_ID=MMETSP0724-20121128/1739_1 /TAXON_ID=265536 /ORGANISM="Amphiprora sp., Strain CCMP467" /LENGTH=566 /DNA_ID=CAMNT_0008767393 /DNA_START=1343 /DNA_END=3040 /DNA_ORIENTATION=+